MQKILISSCLLGNNVNYLGGNAYFAHPLMQKWAAEGRFITVCPEVQGGASIPRAPAVIVGQGGGAAVLRGKASLKNNLGEDVTDVFVKGAAAALNIAQRHDIKIAILKERSPSCGSNAIYAEDFSANKIPGEGVTAALLRQYNIEVFSEEQIESAAAYLTALESQMM